MKFGMNARISIYYLTTYVISETFGESPTSNIILRSGSLIYKNVRDGFYDTIADIGIHMCVLKCLSRIRCKSIIYKHRELQCGLLAVSFATADFISTHQSSHSAFTDKDEWITEESEKCKSTCVGASRCLTSKRGTLMCVKQDETFFFLNAVNAPRPVILPYQTTSITPSLRHMGHFYYTLPAARKVFITNGRPDGVSKPKYKSFLVESRLLSLTNGALGDKSWLLGLSTQKRIYRYREPRSIDLPRRWLELDGTMKLGYRRDREMITSIQYGLHRIIGIGKTYTEEAVIMCFLVLLGRDRAYQCESGWVKMQSHVTSCFFPGFEDGTLLYSRLKNTLEYRDRYGWKNKNDVLITIFIHLKIQPYLFTFSVDNSQIFALHKVGDRMEMIRMYRRCV